MVKPSDELKKKFNPPEYKEAETIADIVKVTGLGETTVRRHAKRMVDAGIWKQVTKKEKHHFTTAYIKIK